MRALSLFFTASLVYGTSAFADLIQLKPIFNSKASAIVTVTEDTRTEVKYKLTVEEKNQNYAILVYRKGDCKDFSDPVAVMVDDPTAKGKKIPFNAKGNQFLIFQPAAKELVLAGSAVAPANSFFTFEPRGKILVLVAIENEQSESGLALACGIYP